MRLATRFNLEEEGRAPGGQDSGQDSGQEDHARTTPDAPDSRTHLACVGTLYKSLIDALHAHVAK